MDDTNPFVIEKTAEEVAEEAVMNAQGAADADATGDTLGSVEDLIPLCAKHPHGPQLSTATFGYDLAQMERRPWNDPAATQSDYFNYGFNESTWRVYCAMQAEGEGALLARANEMLEKLQLTAAPGPAAEEASAGGAAPYEQAGGAPGYGGAGGGYERRGGGEAQRALYKTKLCKSYADGRCTRGSDCNYAHGMSELRSAPPMPSGGGYMQEGRGHPHPHPHHGGGAGTYITPPHQPQFHQMPPMTGYDPASGAGHMGQKRYRGEGGY